jgi:hypothetical protein
VPDTPAEPPKPVDRPLMLGEIFSEAIRLYGDRPGPALIVGAIGGASTLVGFVSPFVAAPFVALAFTASWAVAAQLAAGRDNRTAWAEVVRQAPSLVILTLIVVVPFSIALSQLFLFVVAVGWLALVGFSIPVVVLEEGEERWYRRFVFGLQRSVRIAWAEYLHALGVAAALLIAVLLVVLLLLGTLQDVADAGRLAALVLAEVAIAPFLFLSLGVLYLDQRAREISSR